MEDTEKKKNKKNGTAALSYRVAHERNSRLQQTITIELDICAYLLSKNALRPIKQPKGKLALEAGSN